MDKHIETYLSHNFISQREPLHSFYIGFLRQMLLDERHHLTICDHKVLLNLNAIVIKFCILYPT